MIRLLPVVALLLALAAMASAECAWVLWQETSADRIAPGRPDDPVTFLRGPSSWQIHGTYDTKVACQAKEDLMWPEVRRERGPITRDGEVVALTMTKLMRFPDTVDPRGAKGGAR